MSQETNRNGADYPLDNLTFNLITIMHKKSKAIEAYDKYLADAQDDEDIRELLEEMRSQDEMYVTQLQQNLVRLLTVQAESDSASSNTSKARSARASGTGSSTHNASASQHRSSSSRAK
jgi:hypothetical protein